MPNNKKLITIIVLIVFAMLFSSMVSASEVKTKRVRNFSTDLLKESVSYSYLFTFKKTPPYYIRHRIDGYLGSIQKSSTKEYADLKLCPSPMSYKKTGKNYSSGGWDYYYDISDDVNTTVSGVKYNLYKKQDGLILMSFGGYQHSGDTRINNVLISFGTSGYGVYPDGDDFSLVRFKSITHCGPIGSVTNPDWHEDYSNIVYMLKPTISTVTKFGQKKTLMESEAIWHRTLAVARTKDAADYIENKLKKAFDGVFKTRWVVESSIKRLWLYRDKSKGFKDFKSDAELD
ncbi:MAG: hypothetical protein KUF72_03755 [Candidatus Thiodiazotropha sp. (ex Ctena orbiculata)]|nr:hypothetical protein [Candidatus Thiodiazotropha taylori]